MSQKIPFDHAFHALTGHEPFPWQRELYKRMTDGPPPSACRIPTGLGKTAVIAVWLIALARCGKETANGKRLARRLVYVVNRRTVVDQSTDVVEKIRERLLDPNRADSKRDREILHKLRERLQDLAATDDIPLAVSTLRGQLADNAEWRSDPARPAVILGTVDMIGSRLLFSGYGRGFKTKPLHAGFLGQDVLLVHDEAHLEPAFQRLLTEIEREQASRKDFCPMHVMELTATSRGQEEKKDRETKDKIIALSKEHKSQSVVKRRINAKKNLVFREIDNEKTLADEMAKFVLDTHKDSGQAVLVFARAVQDVDKIVAKLRKTTPRVEPLTGTLRGLERDGLVKSSVFQRFSRVFFLQSP